MKKFFNYSKIKIPTKGETTNQNIEKSVGITKNKVHCFYPFTVHTGVTMIPVTP